MKKERNLFLKRPFSSSLSEANLKEKSRKFGNKSSKNKLRILNPQKINIIILLILILRNLKINQNQGHKQLLFHLIYFQDPKMKI